jgi:hypothetical protein
MERAKRCVLVMCGMYSIVIEVAYLAAGDRSLLLAGRSFGEDGGWSRWEVDIRHQAEQGLDEEREEIVEVDIGHQAK